MMRVLILLSIPSSGLEVVCFGEHLSTPHLDAAERAVSVVWPFEVVPTSERAVSVVRPFEVVPIFERDEYLLTMFEDLLMVIPDRKKYSPKNMLQVSKHPIKHDFKKSSYKKKVSYNRKMLSR